MRPTIQRTAESILLQPAGRWIFAAHREILVGMRLRSAILGLISLLITAACSGKESLVTVVGPGRVNDPKNKSLRFDILKFGLEEFCREMTRRGAPLKLNDSDPVIGRFFADTCSSQVIDADRRKSLVVQYSGRGYAWTAQSLRVGFTSAGVVEYAPDFLVHGGAMYVYFRPSNISAASFETQLIESGIAGSLVSVLGVPVDDLGRHILRSQLERGFTVVRQNRSGEVDFGLGYVPKGEMPLRPFRVERPHKLTLANDSTEVHVGQQDYLGGFEVKKKNRALFLTMTLDGAPTVDVFVVPKSYADQMTGQYVTSPGPAPLTAPPLFEDTLTAGPTVQRKIPVPPGLYFVVLDNSPAIGRSAPPGQVGDDRAAKIDYLVQLGKAK